MGTGLRVSRIRGSSEPAPRPVDWTSVAVFSILCEHEWIEPSESVTEDLLLLLGTPRDEPVLFETRLVAKTWRGRITTFGDEVLFARQVIPASADMSPEPASEVQGTGSGRGSERRDEKVQTGDGESGHST